jgi:hypothetical protein
LHGIAFPIHCIINLHTCSLHLANKPRPRPSLELCHTQRLFRLEFLSDIMICRRPSQLSTLQQSNDLRTRQTSASLRYSKAREEQSHNFSHHI